MIEVKNNVKIYEIDDKDATPIYGECLSVESHWNLSDRVNLRIGGKVYTVIADDLKAAIENATNTQGL